jgi:hypothetical protein
MLNDMLIKVSVVKQNHVRRVDQLHCWSPNRDCCLRPTRLVAAWRWRAWRRREAPSRWSRCPIRARCCSCGRNRTAAPAALAPAALQHRAGPVHRRPAAACSSGKNNGWKNGQTSWLLRCSCRFSTHPYQLHGNFFADWR